MDKIQKVLIKAGRKDLAQKYFDKMAGRWFVKELKSNPKITDIIKKNVGKYTEGGRVKTIDYGFGNVLFEITYNSNLSPKELSTPSRQNRFRQQVENVYFRGLVKELKKETRITKTHFDDLTGIIKIKE